MSEKIIAYKAMDKNMQCRGKQYEVGKTYREDKADCCHAGMHACENPLDVLHYYPLKDGPRFFEVECGGNVDKSGEGSKLACTELTVNGEVNFAGLVKATVNAVFNRVKGKESFSSGDYSTALGTRSKMENLWRRSDRLPYIKAALSGWTGVWKDESFSRL